MTKEELIQFLRENLRVDVSCEIEEYNGDHYTTDNNIVRVRILLCGEVISESSDYHRFPINHETNTYFAR